LDGARAVGEGEHGVGRSGEIDASSPHQIATRRFDVLAAIGGAANGRPSAESQRVRVIGGDDDQSVVGAGHLQGATDGVVEHRRLLDRLGDVVRVQGVIDTPALRP
jgi:hypothetical protein